MTHDHERGLAELRGVCRRLTEARRRVDELERRRDELIRDLRDGGTPGTQLAELAGVSPGRVAQIASRSASHR